MKGNFFVIDKRVLPEVYEKVVKAKKLLKEGKVKEVTEATKLAGVSRSVYYKYKDFVFEFSESPRGQKATFNIMIIDQTGVLSTILNYISSVGGSILTINQGIPLNGYAYVTLTIDINNLDGDIKTLVQDLSRLDRVEKVEFIAME
ncbi:ACT domain-containing protein [Clostridium sp. SHJSY1]|uniref:ACT domain-containing protein n=1 Tax=Clostridium sp. SHJSY1 TaxID=2942483 RepID=UPI0028767B24|nr:ACT domain-containing protein [Clostridium sp. SHJSY1]MDS0525067.1 ACT domain-containing protein [Clostridium sp. SHJSY1]